MGGRFPVQVLRYLTLDPVQAMIHRMTNNFFQNPNK